MQGSGAVAWLQTNVASMEQAEELAGGAVRARMAACANVWEIESVYWWEGKVQREGEVAVHLKTAPGALAALVAFVRKRHPYEVPYIEWGPTGRVEPAYARWVMQEARGRPPGTRRRTSRAGCRATR